METLTAAGAAAAQNEPIANQQRKKISFATMQGQYKTFLSPNGGRTDLSDAYLLSIATQFAEALYAFNLASLSIKNGFDRYAANFATPNFPPISLNYCHYTSLLSMCALSPSFELLIEWELFTLPQMWDKDAFIKNFLYFGEFNHQDSFEVIKNRNGKKGEFEMNPTREFFHKILTNQL